MLDMRERYNVIPSVLMPLPVSSKEEFTEKCRENSIEVLRTKFCPWVTYPSNILSNNQSNNLLKTIKTCLKYYPKKIRDYFKLSRLFKGKKIDLVHTNSSVIGQGDIIAQFLKRPHVWHLREYGADDYNLYHIKPLSYVREAHSRANAIIAISKSLYNSYVNERKLCSPDNTRIIYNGVRVPAPYEKKFLQDKQLNFCIVGFISKGKNQIMALNACEKLKAITDKFTLNIVGTGSDESLNELKQIIRAKGLENYIKLWGWQDHENINKILQNMDVGLMLSRREAFGLVTVEYMLNYMPVIGVNTGATPEIIDNESGFICELDDSEKLADLMQKFITNPELLSQMGSKARERAVKNFSLERNTDQIYELYQEILSRK